MQEQLEKLQALRKSKIILYATVDRPGLSQQIDESIIEVFHKHLEAIGDQELIDILIYSRGGATIVPLPLVRLIRKYCHRFGAIIPFRAHSAATMITVGADEVYMSRRAELGPVDPQLTINSPQGQRVIASTDLFAYLEFAKTELGWQSSNNETSIEILEFLHKYCALSPDFIGKIYRMYTQSKKYIEELAESHAPGHLLGRESVDKLADTLMRSFGSHDYKIDSHEAKNKLGLNIISFDKNLEKNIEDVYVAMATYLKLSAPFVPGAIGTVGSETVGLILSEKMRSNQLFNFKVVKGPDSRPAIDASFSQWL
jgi:Serine dehydrogenase proteinase